MHHSTHSSAPSRHCRTRACRRSGLAGILLLLGTTAAAHAAEFGFDLNADGTVDQVLRSAGAATVAETVAEPPDGWPADRNDDGVLEYGLLEYGEIDAGSGSWSTPGPPLQPAPFQSTPFQSTPFQSTPFQSTPFQSTLLQPAPLEPDVDLPDITFALVWDSGSTLSNVLCVETGDADLDGVFDFAGTHFSPNLIHLFESDGLGGYTEVWNSAGNTPPGSYRDLVFADTDGDGLGEILGAEVSTLGKVMLFEESGSGFIFLHDTIRETDLTGALRLRSVMVGDTNQNGRQEVIVAAGGSNPTSGLVSIWEHNGVVGDNTYLRIYEYQTVSYLFQATLGDSDNDGWAEIVLGLGGFGGNPLIIRRIEYDPGQSTWVHRMFTSSVIGLPTTPHVADLDEDGQNELAYGSSSGSGFVVVFENTGPNSYAPDFMTTATLGGNVLSLDSFPMSDPESMTFVAGSFGGDVGLWSYDADLHAYDQTGSMVGLGGAIRQLSLTDDGDDDYEEFLPAVSATLNQIQVYRREDTVGVSLAAPAPPGRVQLVAAPNPFRALTHLRAGPAVARLSIHDVHGRLVRRLPVRSGLATWDARDGRGRAVAAGVYWARQEGEEPGAWRDAPPLRVVVVR